MKNLKKQYRHTFIEAVQNARRRSLTEKLNEFKEL